MNVIGKYVACRYSIKYLPGDAFLDIVIIARRLMVYFISKGEWDT